MIFRSEPMRLFELKVAVESGWYFMEEVGQTSMIEIVPQEYERYKKNMYAEQVEQCRELTARLDYIETICHSLGMEINRAPGLYDELQELCTRFLDRHDDTEPLRHTLLNGIMDSVHLKETTIREVYQNYEQLLTKRSQIIEQYHVLKEIAKVLPTSDVALRNADDNSDENKLETFGFYYLCGTIDARDAYRLQRYVFRVSRENVIFQLIDLTYKTDKLKPEKLPAPRKIYFIVFQAGSSPIMRQKIKEGLRTFNNVPVRLPLYYSKMNEIETFLEEEFKGVEDLLGKTLTRLRSNLTQFTETKESGVSFMEECRIRVGKDLRIYEELNKFKLEDKILSAWVWVPAEDQDQLKARITHMTNHNPNIKAYVLDASYENLRIVPPTYFKLSDVTAPFQEIVDTYGVPRFGEANPGLPTIVTFPYLFGIMFGDIGHGAILLGFAFMLVKFSELWRQKGLALVNYRFMFLALGFFACFCGLIYNDFLGIPWRLFPSCFRRVHKRFERNDPDCTYIAGFDSTWFESKQEIGFMNSFKMKLSIIVGVVHMVGGIMLKGVNNLHFGQYIDFLFEFLPQLVFMLTTFGYMCFAIVAKWLIDWGDGSNAPSIISLFINLGYTAPGQNMYGDDQGIKQTAFQQNLFVIAGICVVLMLVPKPLLLWLKHRDSGGHSEGKRGSKNLVELVEHGADVQEKLLTQAEPVAAKMQNPHAVVEEVHDISEIFIHQMIETIEFVLGSISNTASYLRLWALSLAHGQLARVFLDMTVLNQLKGGSAIGAVAGFPIFVGATFGVLMCMDLMECFLHTLRLHWVEFQNKFYKGDGYKFVPFNLVESIQRHLESTRLNLDADS